jgi:2-dehydropantoate 2-reductase
MKTVVLGAGALGSILAAHLARAGQDVALIARGPRAKLLAERGVSVRGMVEFTVEVPIVERAQELEACDVFVMTAKTYDTQAALEGVKGLKADMAMSVQNGVVKNEHLAAVFGPSHTAGCIANFSGEVAEDGAVLFTRNEGLYFGELPQGTSPRTEEFARILNDAGIKAIASDRIQSVEWSKYSTWMGLTAVAVLSRLYTHLVYQDEGLDLLQTEVTREAVALAKAFGVDVMDLGGLIFPKTMSEAEAEECVAVLKKAGAAMEAGGTTTHRMSALQDLLRGRHLEVEETYGYAVARGAEMGVPMPHLETCYRLLAAINRNTGS